MVVDDTYTIAITREDEFRGFLIRVSSALGDVDASSAITHVPGDNLVQGGSSFQLGTKEVQCDEMVSGATHVNSDIKTRSEATLQFQEVASLLVEITVMTDFGTKYYYGDFNANFVTSTEVFEPTADPISSQIKPSPFPSLDSVPLPSAQPTSIPRSQTTECVSTDPAYTSMLSLDDELDLFWNETSSTSKSISMRLKYRGVGWLAIGPTLPQRTMIGGEVVLGLPESGSALKYTLSSYSSSGVDVRNSEYQTLINNGVVQENSETILTFTKLLVEEGEIEIQAVGPNNIIWAYDDSNDLSFHRRFGAEIIDFSQPCGVGAVSFEFESKESMWKAHGAMMVAAWLCLAPIGVSASMLRAYFPEKWFHIHRAAALLCAILTLISFIVAVVTIEDEGTSHIDGNHQAIGLTVFVALVVQIIGGIIRPHSPREDEDKQIERKVWENVHRAFGLTVLILSGLACISGAIKYDDKYGTDDSQIYVLIIFVSIAILLLISKVIGTMKKKSLYVEEVTNPDPVLSERHN